MELTKSERMELQQQVSARNGRADAARHARLILLLADGLTWAEIRNKLDCSDSYIDRWSMTVARIWAKHGIKPHLLEGYLTSNDPDFETKASDVIGLYLNPPQNAVVFSVDEKTAIQALDRLDPVLPLSPGRAERHGFEYFRHGTLSLHAAFNTKTGEVLGKTATRHTSAEFVAFLTDIVANQPKGKEIHVIADNLSGPTRPSWSISSWPRTATFICTSPRRAYFGECDRSFRRIVTGHIRRNTQ